MLFPASLLPELLGLLSLGLILGIETQEEAKGGLGGGAAEECDLIFLLEEKE